VVIALRGFSLADLKKQSICFKVCFKIGKNCVDLHEILKTALGDNVKGTIQTSGSFSMFKTRGKFG
jgi:hypothetical protein